MTASRWSRPGASSCCGNASGPGGDARGDRDLRRDLHLLLAWAAEPQRAWLTVAMASTLAGNLTLIGSVANLIVVEIAHGGGLRIGFWRHFRVGAPVTVLTILAGLWWL